MRGEWLFLPHQIKHSINKYNEYQTKPMISMSHYRRWIAEMAWQRLRMGWRELSGLWIRSCRSLPPIEINLRMSSQDSAVVGGPDEASREGLQAREWMMRERERERDPWEWVKRETDTETELWAVSEEGGKKKLISRVRWEPFFSQQIYMPGFDVCWGGLVCVEIDYIGFKFFTGAPIFWWSSS